MTEQWIEISGLHCQEISCRNSLNMIDYMKEHYGTDAIAQTFSGILEPDTMLSSIYCFRGRPIDLAFFEQVENWYPHTINIRIFENLARLKVDLFRMGFHSVRRAAKINNLAVTGLMHGFGPVGVIKKASKILSLYNRTKAAEIELLKRDRTVLRIDYNKGFKHSVYITRYNLGTYVAALQLTGAQNVKAQILEDVYSTEGGYSRLEFIWQRESLWQRLRWIGGLLVSNLFARTYLKSHHAVKHYHADLIDGLQREIEQKEKAQQEKEEYYQAMVEALELRESMLEAEVKTTALQQALEQKELMFSNFAHEVRTPLMLALNPVRRVRQLLRDERCQALLATAEINLEDLQRLVTQLIALETESDYAPANSAPVNLMQVVNQVVDSVRFELNEHQLQLNVHVDENLRCLLAAEPLRQMIINLLENAIKYCRPGDSVYVSASGCEQGVTQVVVEDSGPGIPAGHHQKIFERFHRALGVENICGSGIGLAIVRRLVEAQGGRIECSTSAYGGAKFTLRLPCQAHTCVGNNEMQSSINHKPTDKARTKEAASSTAGYKGINQAIKTKDAQNAPGPRILVVEDNDELRAYLCELLDEDYLCDAVTDGEAAWQRILTHTPDLVLSDVMMPGIDGYQLTRRIKMHLQTCHVPVILLTAKGDLQSELNGLRVEAADYLTKPVLDEVLLQKVANLLTQQKRLLQYTRQQLECGNKVNELLTLPHEKFKTDLDAYLENNYPREDLTIGDIAKALAMSERKLQMVCKKALSMTPVQYRKLFRVNKAKELMAKHPEYSKTRVAIECGFGNGSVLSRALSGFEESSRASA